MLTEERVREILQQSIALDAAQAPPGEAVRLAHDEIIELCTLWMGIVALPPRTVPPALKRIGVVTMTSCDGGADADEAKHS